jgi:hypothetical protein
MRGVAAHRYFGSPCNIDPRVLDEHQHSADTPVLHGHGLQAMDTRCVEGGMVTVIGYVTGHAANLAMLAPQRHTVCAFGLFHDRNLYVTWPWPLNSIWCVPAVL